MLLVFPSGVGKIPTTLPPPPSSPPSLSVKMRHTFPLTSMLVICIPPTILLYPMYAPIPCRIPFNLSCSCVFHLLSFGRPPPVRNNPKDGSIPNYMYVCIFNPHLLCGRPPARNLPVFHLLRWVRVPGCQVRRSSRRQPHLCRVLPQVSKEHADIIVLSCLVAVRASPCMRKRHLRGQTHVYCTQPCGLVMEQ